MTDANARTGKICESGEEADIKVLGAYGRDKLNKNGLLLLGFAEDNKLALLNTSFCNPKSGVSYTFQSADRSKEQARLGLILTKQADRGLIRYVNVRRPPLETPESIAISCTLKTHPTQVRTKLEEEGQYQGNSEADRPQTVDN